jgi:hypothetical protein
MSLESSLLYEPKFVIDPWNMPPLTGKNPGVALRINPLRVLSPSLCGFGIIGYFLGGIHFTKHVPRVLSCLRNHRV